MTCGWVAKASAELAFRDMFLTIVVTFIGAMPLLLLLRRRQRGAGPAGPARVAD